MVKTINEYLNTMPDMHSEDGKTLKETMADIMQIWDNSACAGYCILAMQRCGCSKKQIKEVFKAIWREFDCTTIDKAQQTSFDFDCYATWSEED